VSRHTLTVVARAWWRREKSALRNTIVEVDRDGRAVARHHVRHFDDCPVCGRGAPDRNQAPPRLHAVRKHPASDTGARAGDPEEVWARFEHLISPLTGAVRHVREIDVGAPSLIHVFTAGHAVRMDTDSLRGFMRDGRDASGGKGSSAAQARASALCEALERFSWIFRGDEVDAWGTLRSVEGSLDPSRFLLFSENQYASREAWNEKITSGFQKVPEPFDPDREIAWSRVWSLVSGAEAFVPTSLLYRGFGGPGATFCNADTNGLAAGLTLEESILQGFLELVERDAVALWWYNRTRHPAVDARSDPYVARVFDHYASIGREAWVLDLTSDLEVPVYAALSARTGPGRPEIIFGFGAHLDAAIALRRSVTEMNQMLATVIRPPQNRDAQLRGEFSDALAWWADATLDEHPYLLPSPRAVRLDGALGSRPPGSDILEDVRACLDVAQRHRLDVYVRDMTRPDVGLPVVKVLVPDLRSFWRRLAPGRLYDAPVALGRLHAPLDEAAMNRVSMFV
jgi:thiazole/oxazole-forming peptide maturase SagD family component